MSGDEGLAKKLVEDDPPPAGSKTGSPQEGTEKLAKEPKKSSTEQARSKTRSKKKE